MKNETLKIEFAGLRSTGKTTTIANLTEYFQKRGFTAEEHFQSSSLIPQSIPKLSFFK